MSQTPQPRAIVIVLDGCGAGAAPDAADFGDHDGPDTIKHVWDHVNGFHAPNLQNTGFLAACGIGEAPNATYGRLRPISQGKDSVTGHWEMMGAIVETRFPTYPNGFPEDLIAEFDNKTNRTAIGNKAASGTQIIQDLGNEHVKTGNPIVYTSADSVFQIACHEEIVAPSELYDICKIAREICTAPNNIQRVIARPFIGSSEAGFTRTENRKDFPVVPPHNLVDEIGDVYGVGVVPELFGGRGFRKTTRTQSNKHHEKELFKALESNARFIFANFEDFDMLYGHRSDPKGFSKCLEDFDLTLGKLISKLQDQDLLILTADHGNDPTDKSTDHTREYVPLAIVNQQIKPENKGDLEGLSVVGDQVENHLNHTTC